MPDEAIAQTIAEPRHRHPGRSHRPHPRLSHRGVAARTGADPGRVPRLSRHYGRGFVDYFIADSYTAPRTSCSRISPSGSCACPIAICPTAPMVPSRSEFRHGAECGLPDDGFVFCSFNQLIKFTPDLFESGCACWRAFRAACSGFAAATRPRTETCGRKPRRAASTRAPRVRFAGSVARRASGPPAPGRHFSRYVSL